MEIQVKGRGEFQTNERYRWFQIRTTLKQREETIAEGLSVNESWRKKVAKTDFFILVSLKYQEFWIFDSNDIADLIQINRNYYGNRKDNLEGIQVEIDLDVEHNGKTIAEIYTSNLNNWELILNQFRTD